MLKIQLTLSGLVPQFKLIITDQPLQPGYRQSGLFPGCAAQGCGQPVIAPPVCESDWPALISFNFLSAPSAHCLLRFLKTGE